jgi:dTMP kinase
MLIVFEGADGTGKSTVINAVAKALQLYDLPRGNRKVLTTSALNGTETARKSRKYLIEKHGDTHKDIDKMLDAIKSVQVETVDALHRDTIILCDRWFHSTIVYQGLKNNALKYVFDGINARKIREPKLTFILTCDPAEIEKRLKARKDNDVCDPVDLNEIKLIQNYYKAEFEGRKNIVFLDTTNKDINDVVAEVLKRII